MNRKPYHHGNLEEMLIETGIEIINKEGVERFSIRKVATACGVSHAAPYKHFADKDELLRAMQRHVSVKFAAYLEDSLNNHEHEPERMMYMGRAYVKFFLDNPHYFHFFTTQYGEEMDLEKLDSAGGNLPFDVFRKAFMEVMRENGVPSHLHQKLLISEWAMVHGITALAHMKGIRLEGDWIELVTDIMKNLSWKRE